MKPSSFAQAKRRFIKVDSKQADLVHERNFKIMEPGEKLKIGSLEIEMVPVDHSLPKACRDMIYTNEGNPVLGKSRPPGNIILQLYLKWPSD